MEAKDTVMSNEDILDKLRELSDDHWAKVLDDIHYYERELQAEISFKAGIKEVVDWINSNWFYASCGDMYLHGDKWQAQLKEWGISSKE